MDIINEYLKYIEEGPVKTALKKVFLKKEKPLPPAMAALCKRKRELQSQYGPHRQKVKACGNDQACKNKLHLISLKRLDELERLNKKTDGYC